MWWAAAIFGWFVFAAWLVLLGPSGVLFFLRTLPRGVRRMEPPGLWPKVTVVVPARDEAAAIERCLRRILASDYPSFEVIAVNDRSGDGTGEIMDRVAADDPRLKVIRIAELPEGWLGKNHAMHSAVSAASGELLLFTDGDVTFDAGTIRRAVTYLVRKNLDHLCLTPTLIGGGYFERGLLAYFGVMYALGSQPWLVSSSFKLAYAGVGAFNLVRRAPLLETGGFETLRLEVVEDVMLGKLIKSSGYRQDVLRSDGDVSVRWQPSAWGVIKGLEKNFFPAVGYSVRAVLVVTLLHALFLVWPYAAVCVFGDARLLGYAAALLFLHAIFALSGAASPRGWLVFPLLPAAALGMLLALWRSMVITLSQGGIRWRETFYPLELLRSHRALQGAIPGKRPDGNPRPAASAATSADSLD